MDDETYQKLLGFGLNYISIRPRSEKEIHSYILKKINKWKISPEFFEKVLNRLNELGYVNDLKFALAYIASRNQFRPKGKRVIQLELQRKGISDQTIEDALQLSQGGQGDQERELARSAATKKLRGLERYDRISRRHKLYNFLLRRGFSRDTIVPVIDELCPKGLQ